MMMTRLSVLAVVAAAATLAQQASASGGYDTSEMPSDPTPAPVMDSTSTSSPTSSGGGEMAEYLGCFHDSKGDRVLGDMLDDPDMTTEMCLEYCTELGAAFMATQWAFQCWCSPDGGLDYNRHFEMMGTDAVCDMPCMGDETQICGGFDSFELYKIGPVSSECASPVEAYEQCGGEDWMGSTCCAEGYECVDVSTEGCYSQCRPAGVEEATPSPSTMGAPTPSTPAPVSMDRETASPVEPMAPETPSPVEPMTEPPVAEPMTNPPVAEPMTEPPVAEPMTEPPVAEPMTEPPVAAPTTPTGDTPADMVDILDLHNNARCIHNADPLAWSGDVEASAAVHAKRMSDKCDGLFHSESDERNGYGENIYWCGNSGGCYSAESAMNGFYDSEIQTDSVSGYGGHATQILWKSSELLGCAVSSCSSGSMPGDYLACQYDPPGNYMNDLENQVDLPTNAGNC